MDGEDTRKTFTDHLYAALKQAGIRTFRDDDAMDRGKLLGPELKKAIRESAISIIVFSRNYATSKWCLDEVLTIIEEQERLSSKHEVVPVFYDVEPSDVRNQTGSFEEAFGEYDNMIEAETDHQKKNEWREKVKAWRVSLRKAGSLTGMVLANGYDTLEDTNDKDLFLHVACFFVGEDKEFIVKLLAECDMYPIVGIQNLMDRCLLYIEDGRVKMHQLIQEMGQEVVRQESPKDPGKRSRLWHHQDSFNVLKENGVRSLERLVSLDISGCMSLKDISCLPKSLVSFKIHGCSNLGGVRQIQCLHSFSQSSLLVDIDISKCSIFDNSFPEDWSNLFALKILNISGNNITSLPTCVKSLPSLEELYSNYCSYLKSVLDVPKSITELQSYANMSLEIVQPPPNPLTFLLVDRCEKLCVVEGCLKRESIKKVDRKVIRYLGLSSISENGMGFGFDKQNAYTEEVSTKVLFLNMYHMSLESSVPAFQGKRFHVLGIKKLDQRYHLEFLHILMVQE
ncbi:hypothetical protein L1987_32114 [Smallanthus sonchifolius]|uniref:Uncharacterized protein n=1 Tax=Smallanthus sonchifolius TaxID=185202 RepID=A0ACB9I6S7_9ASTR|nr:hypothetical protein L1987_32114 [Smallanthus sonchifolius]